MTERLLTLCILLLASAAPAVHAADAYPARVVRWILPTAPGAGVDATARIVGAKLTEKWGQQIVIDNRAGAEGVIGTAMGAKAPADGYTLLFVHLGTLAINPHLYSDTGYDSRRDFSAVARLTMQSQILAAHPSVPAHSMQELVAYARQNPGRLTFGTGSSLTRLAGELYKMTTGVDIRQIQYKGTGPALIDLLSGQVSLMIPAPTAVVPHIKSGKLRGLVVLGGKRLEALPEVPTSAETGYPDLYVIAWYGVVVPAATPRRIVSFLNADINRALSSPDVIQHLQAIGLTVAPSTPEEFGRQIADDFVRWGKIVKASGTKGE
jgi:tripartite-type tricarboxylate transporter receptor subunit TctC